MYVYRKVFAFTFITNVRLAQFYVTATVCTSLFMKIQLTEEDNQLLTTNFLLHHLSFVRTTKQKSDRFEV